MAGKIKQPKKTKAKAKEKSPSVPVEESASKDTQVTVADNTPTTESTSETLVPDTTGIAGASTEITEAATEAVTEAPTETTNKETETTTNTLANDTANSSSNPEKKTKKRKHAESTYYKELNKNKEEVPNKPKPVLGRPVSKRSWKVRDQKRVSAMNAGDEAHPSRWGTNQEKEKDRRKKIQAIESEVKAKRKADAEAKRKSIEVNKQRFKDKQLKATTIQIVKDPRKIKKMSRKRQKMFSHININELEFTRVV